jgi:endo-1,4-beta-xylanase
MKITRRACLRAAAAIPAVLASPLMAAKLWRDDSWTSLPRLRDVAADAGLLFGSDSDFYFRDVAAGYQPLFLNQCALYVGNLSWGVVARESPRENDDADPNVAVALASGLKLTGSHLLWYRSTPKWFEALSKTQAQEALAKHIQELAAFYRGRCFSWNVVNEAIEPRENGPNGLRINNSLARMLGPEFFFDAFREARTADPGALLLYNDYDLELNTPEQESRRSALLNLLDRMQKAQVPIDGVGLQSHLRFNRLDAFNETIYRRFLHELAARGMKIVISEIDVDDIGMPSDPKIRDQQVAQVYASFLAVALDEIAVTALVTWGLCDAYSWHNRTQFFPEYIRPDHQPQRPLLFDADLHAKPAFYAVLNALKQAPKRPMVLSAQSSPQ